MTTKDLPQERSKKLLVETWGCQMNVADSENMVSLLEAENYTTTTDPLDADVVLLNTCHIREKAKHKVLSRLGVLRDLKKENPNMKVVVAGCVAEAEGEKLKKQASNIDVLLGPGKIADLPELLKNQKSTQKTVSSLGFPKGLSKSSFTTSAKKPLGDRTEISRFVTIAQGCNNVCTFCVVPFTRGREISRPFHDIITECSNLVSTGAKEITLLGQNVNSYGNDLLKANLKIEHGSPFVQLLQGVLAIPGLQRLRFTTSNPHDFTRSLANLFVSNKKMGRYIHLPVQSGDNEILRTMNRKVTAEEYLEKVSWLKQIPDFAISTDLIVGFPGETEDQFANTLELVNKVGYSFFYSFKYSPRKGTAAARKKDAISEEVKTKRLKKLNDIQNEITIQQNQNEIGKQRSLLVHYQSRKEKDCYNGRTEQFRLVKIKARRNIIGRTLEVKITDANKTGLVGILI